MRYRNLLFDLDGTLTDPYEGITRCVAHALAARDIAIDDRRTLARYIGPPLREAFEQFHGLSRNDARQAVVDYRERFARIGLYENRVYDGIETLLAGLVADGRALYVATSKPHVYARRILAHFGLAGYFQRIHGSELDGRRTDKQALIAHILEQEGLDAADTLMIGDRCFDIDGAHANGLAAVAVRYGYGSARELADAVPLACLDTPAALRDWLEHAAVAAD